MKTDSVTVEKQNAEKEGRIIQIRSCDSYTRKGQPIMLIGASCTIALHRKSLSTNEPKLPSRITKKVLKEEFPEVYELLVQKNSNGSDIWVPNPGNVMQLRIPSNGLRLDPLDTFHAFWIELLKEGLYPEVGTSKMALPDQKFYIYDESAEADTIIKKAELKSKCFDYIKNKTGDDLVQLLALFGQDTKNISSKTAQSRLITLAENSPNDFAEKIKDNVYARDLIDLNMMVEYGILRREGSVYKHGDEVLGSDPKETIKALRAKDKQTLKIALLQQLDTARKQF